MVFIFWEKVKNWAEGRKNDVFVALVIFLTSIASFGLGRLSAIMPEKQQIQITNDGVVKSASIAPSASDPKIAIPNPMGTYVASKNGTAYHFPWCSGAQRIKEGNKIWFQTKEEAEKAGYRPAANCDGL